MLVAMPARVEGFQVDAEALLDVGRVDVLQRLLRQMVLQLAHLRGPNGEGEHGEQSAKNRARSSTAGACTIWTRSGWDLKRCQASSDVQVCVVRCLCLCSTDHRCSLPIKPAQHPITEHLSLGERKKRGGGGEGRRAGVVPSALRASRRRSRIWERNDASEPSFTHLTMFVRTKPGLAILALLGSSGC